MHGWNSRPNLLTGCSVGTFPIVLVGMGHFSSMVRTSNSDHCGLHALSTSNIYFLVQTEGLKEVWLFSFLSNILTITVLKAPATTTQMFPCLVISPTKWIYLCFLNGFTLTAVLCGGLTIIEHNLEVEWPLVQSPITPPFLSETPQEQLFYLACTRTSC